MKGRGFEPHQVLCASLPMHSPETLDDAALMCRSLPACHPQLFCASFAILALPFWLLKFAVADRSTPLFLKCLDGFHARCLLSYPRTKGSTRSIWGSPLDSYHRRPYLRYIINIFLQLPSPACNLMTAPQYPQPSVSFCAANPATATARFLLGL